MLHIVYRLKRYIRQKSGNETDTQFPSDLTISEMIS